MQIPMKTALVGLTIASLMSGTAMAADLSMWVRESAADTGTIMVDYWNATHDTQIELTAIPDTQLVTKLATSVRAGDAPDLVSFDLIYMPDFMRAGFLTDLTDQLEAIPSFAAQAEAFADIATYEDKVYGVGFTPAMSVLVWNKKLFREAGLDPEVGPKSIYEIHEMAKKIGALGDDTYGFYFSGACPGCNIFATSPMMVAGGAKILPRNGDDTALEGEAIYEVLDQMRQMWEEGLIPQAAETDNGANWIAGFTNGNVGISGTGGVVLTQMDQNFPNLDYGVSLLPGLEPGQVSSFVGGDVIAIPANSANEALARDFVAWILSDDAQINGLAKMGVLPTRTDLSGNDYVAGDPNLRITAEALVAGYVPWVFHFAAMVNSDSSPWISMLQRATFDGDVESAIDDARAEMMNIASN